MALALKRGWVVPALCGLFVLLNAVAIANRFYWFSLLPVVLLIGWAMVAAVDKLLIFVAFATPLSINLEELDLGGIGISLPTEPIMVGLTLLFWLKMAVEREVLDPRVWRHPITWVVIAQLVWMVVCILPSSMPMVSVKFLLARLWFVTTMFLMATRLFAEPRNIHRFLWAYLAGLSIVVVYTLVRHAANGFEHEPAHWVMTPFFKDHTSYGAILAFFIPFGLGALTLPGYSFGRRLVAAFVFILIAFGLVFSFTRAAWLSLLGAVGVFAIIRFRVPTWVIAVGVLACGAVMFAEREQITIALERNREESSDDMGTHVRSISNISSDASNLERINRWNSALRMWNERPFFGWGPGTYMFQYAPFQAAEDRTIISTNFGLNGNAHSEYLGPLAEQGVPGMLLVLALIAVTTVVVLRLYRRMPAGQHRRVVLLLFLGLVTYYLHAALNNFLDLDKASVPFWAFTAVVVVMDLRYPKAEPAPQ